jgi:hypothetical protein
MEAVHAVMSEKSEPDNEVFTVEALRLLKRQSLLRHKSRVQIAQLARHTADAVIHFGAAKAGRLRRI